MLVLCVSGLWDLALVNSLSSHTVIPWHVYSSHTPPHYGHHVYPMACQLRQGVATCGVLTLQQMMAGQFSRFSHSHCVFLLVVTGGEFSLS